ncbi:hypothetical protein QVD17_21012 [Tagetes erecta]|uniref:Uncharacterized protein n=1 Tax=Tagetes erecta TaxID=13708 RepID=A0AAD8NYH5_TARER|nr:hypothetical protein QVD17_21012 [Tagetes erecta]
MENVKKKRLDVRTCDGKLSGKKIRSQKEGFNDGVTTSEDAELEEFLAILKRLQAGINQFREKNTANTGDCVRKSPVMTGLGLWKPGFELGDFNQLHHAGDVENKKDVVFGFDLNVDPVSD